jgi:signal transduction histidine kinase
VKSRNRIASGTVLLLAAVALPAVLLFSSIRTLHEIEVQRSVYLRHRVAMLAARLENLPPAAASAPPAQLGLDDPDLVDLQVVERGGRGDSPELAPIWEGRELFRTEMTTTAEGLVFRAYIPFHSGGALRVARIDLAGAAADFLTVHARHNVIVSLVAGIVLAALSLVALWAVRRAERARLHEVELENLARIGKMSAVLAHEIRNPLGTIKGFVQLAGESGGAATRDLLAPALAEVLRLESLVNDLLAYGRPPAPAPSLVGWSDIAARLRAHAAPLAGDRPIHLLAPDVPLALYTDPALLGQALLNLLRNAVEAIPDGTTGEVHVEAAAEGERGVVITVTDNGSGFSEEALTKLYEPFFTTKAFGTGLGLAITRRLAESLGGELEVRRRIEGGAEAILRLPDARRPTPAMAGAKHGSDPYSR